MKVNIFYRKCLGRLICSSLFLLILGCSADTGVPIFSKLPSDLANTIRPVAFFYGAKVTGTQANDQTCADALAKNINLVNDGFKPTNTLAFTSKQKYNLTDIFSSKKALDITDQTKAEVYYYSNINTNNPVRVLLDFKADELVKFNSVNGEFSSNKVQLFFKSLLSKDTYDEGDYFTFTSPNGAYDINDNCSDGSSDSNLKLGIIGFTSRDYDNDNLASIRKNVYTPASQNCSLKASLFCVSTIEKNTTFNPTQIAINTISTFTLKSNTINGLLNNLTLSDEFSQKYDNNFPSIIWTSAPNNTKSLALTVTQDSNIHLVLYNIPYTPNFTIPKLLGYNPDFTTVWKSGNVIIGKNSFPGLNGGSGWAGTNLSQTPYKFTLYAFENQNLQFVDPEDINIANFEKKEAPYNFISKAYFIGITPKTFSLISNSTDKGFDQGGLIPLQFNSNQQNNFPKISWINAPTDASSFVLIVSDSSGKTNFILYDIPKNLVTLDWLAGSIASGANFPTAYGRVGTNAYGVRGWTGFKTGESYTFRLFAMRTTTTNAPSSEDLQSFVSTYGKGPSGNNTIIASAVLNGSATSLPLKLFSTYATRDASILGFTPNGNLDISFNQEKAGGLNNFPKLSWDDGPSPSKIKSYLLYITSQNKTLGLIYNINPNTKNLDFTLGPDPENNICVDCSWATNSFGKTGWSGPEEAGVIEFTLIALDKKFNNNEVNSPNQFKSGGEFYKFILNKDLDIAKTQASASAPYKLNSDLSNYGGGFTPSVTTSSASIIEGLIPLEFNKNTAIKEQKNNFPALYWQNPPISTSSYVLIITNKENDSANLILSNIPSSLIRIPKQSSPVDLRTFGKVIQNSFMQDWTGFEPGFTYKFTLYSLNVQSITGALPALNLSNYNNTTFRTTYSSIIRSQASIEAKASVPPLYAWSSLADFGFDSFPPSTTIQDIPLEFSQLLTGGGNNFPKISWQGGNPIVIKSYVLAVTSNGKTNLLLYNIPTNLNNFPRILGPNPNFKNICNSCEAVINSFGVTGWSGPNDTNNYVFKIYALDINDYSSLAINSVSQFEKGGNYFSNVKYTASFTGRGSPPFILTSDLNRNGFDPTNGVVIPNRFQKISGHTSQKNDFPFLSWSNPPNPPTTPTRSYALVIYDKDNDLANALISNIPYTRGLTPLVTIPGELGPYPERNLTFTNNCPTCLWATNSYNNAGWTGFDPEKNYRIRLYALNTTTLSPTLALTTYKYSSFEKAYSNLINGSTFIDVTTGSLPLLLWSSIQNGGFSTNAGGAMPHLFTSQSLGGLNFFPFISWIGGSTLIKSYVLSVSSNTGNTHLLLYNIPLIKKIDQLSFDSNSNFDFGCGGNTCGLTVSNSFKKVWSGPELNQTVTFKLYGLNTSLPTIQVKSINQFENGGDFNNPSSNLVVMESPPITIAAPSPFTLNTMPGIAFHGGGFIKWDSLNNATMPIEFNSDTSIKDQFNNFPALEWTNNVIGAKSYVIIINDITNTNNIQTNFLLSNIPGNINFINKQINTVNWSTIGTVTSNSQNNNWIGFTAGHIYNFRVYALNVTNLVPPLILSNSNETDFLNTYGKTANRNILAYTSILGKASSAPLNFWSSVGVGVVGGGSNSGENSGFNSNPPYTLSQIPSQFNSIGFGGINSFPKINWNGGPTNVQSYALSVISGSGANSKTHLMLYNIPSNFNSLPKIPGPVPNFISVCNTCIWASTSFNSEAWYGANINSPYSFKLYALSTSNYNSTPVITFDRSKFEKDYKNEILDSKEIKVQSNNNFTLSSNVRGLFNSYQTRNSDLIPLEFNNDITYNTQQNNFPNLSWRNIPSGTESFVLIVTNKDNKKSHLILYDINKSTVNIPNVLGGLENWATVGKVALNTYNKMGWTGFESNNNYKFSLYALTFSSIPATINLSNITDDTDFINTFGNNNVNAILGLAQVEGKSSTTPLTIWSSASTGGFDPNMPIPIEFSQVGNNYFPSISWGGGANALSYILYVNRVGDNKNHLILHSIPAELTGRNKGIPKLTFTNANSNFSNGCGAYTCGVPVNPNTDYSTSNDGWAGPLDDTATYTFTLFALKTNNYSTNIPTTPLAFENSSYKSNILNKAILNVLGATQSPIPSNPTLLVASINSVKQVVLSWKTSSKATFYNIYRSSSSPVSTVTVLSVSSINSYIDQNVASGEKYFYVVKAGNSLGLSTGASNEVNVTFAPSEVTNLVAILNNVGNISLSWVGVYGATSYKIFRDTNNIINTNRLANFTTVPPNTSFTDTTATSGTSYFYTILSNNAGGDATLTSNTISITPQILIPVITTITAVNTLVAINWTSGYGALTYNLYRSTTNPFIAGPTNLLISSITNTSISTDNTTLNNTLYYYVVTAVDASANISLQSNWASIQIVPDQATMLISSVTQTEVYLDWVVPARGASSYVIYRDTSNLVSRASGTQFTTSNNKFVDTTAMQGVNYFYIVYSKNDSGYSINPTNIIQASLTAPPVAPSPLPDNPTLLVASINLVNQVELSWQTSSKATFYNIYRSSSSPVSTVTVLSVSSINSYIDQNVASGEKYFYIVKAGNSLGLSTGTSNEVNVTFAPSEVTNLVAILNNVGNISLSWVGVNGATSYKIFRDTNNIINTNRLADFTTVPPNTSFTDATATSGTSYFYTILSNNAGGDATLTSNTISITPQNLIPVITTITAVNTLVTINWTSGYGAQNYNLYRSTTNPFIAGPTNLLVSSITNTSISTDNTTLNNTLYYYVVTAVDASANISLQSNWASIQIVPDQATMLISSVTQTEVYLDWVVPARGASTYVIYRDTSNLVSRASGTQFTTSNNKFVDTTAMQGVNYFYIVYSKNDSGYSINPTNIIQASLTALPVQWLSLTSSQSDGGFNNGGIIPNEFREFANVNGSSQCNGGNNFPKLTWNSSIPNVQSYLLKVQDETNATRFVHFDLFNIPSTTTTISSIASTGTGPKTVDIGFGDTGNNDWFAFTFNPFGANTNTFDGNTTGWSGPCPPNDGKTHTYRFKLYALSTTLTNAQRQPNLDIDTFESINGGMGCTNNTPGTANVGGVNIVLACDSITGTAASATPPKWLSLTSSQSDGGFNNGGTIPNEFREFANVNGSSQCNGGNNFPKLTWNSSIPNVQSYVLIVLDETNGTNWVHFDLYNIPSTTTSISSIASTGTGPKTVNIGFGDTVTNTWREFVFAGFTFDGNTTGWSGPCPPNDGTTHTYRFKLYALNRTLIAANQTPSNDFSQFESENGGSGCTNNTPGNANGAGINNVLACDSITGTASH